jgi:hypothetical protein
MKMSLITARRRAMKSEGKSKYGWYAKMLLEVLGLPFQTFRKSLNKNLSLKFKKN